VNHPTTAGSGGACSSEGLRAAILSVSCIIAIPVCYVPLIDPSLATQQEQLSTYSVVQCLDVQTIYLGISALYRDWVWGASCDHYPKTCLTWVVNKDNLLGKLVLFLARCAS
jgi:hypothetical protein